MVLEINGIFYNLKKIKGESQINYNKRCIRIIYFINKENNYNLTNIFKEHNIKMLGCSY